MNDRLRLFYISAMSAKPLHTRAQLSVVLLWIVLTGLLPWMVESLRLATPRRLSTRAIYIYIVMMLQPAYISVKPSIIHISDASTYFQMDCED